MANLSLTGPPIPQRGEERVFTRGETDAAYAWALAGGIAIHGALGDRQDDERPLRVLGQLPVLLAWGGRHGLPGRSLRPARRGRPAHFQLSGDVARRLAAGRRQQPAPAQEVS